MNISHDKHMKIVEELNLDKKSIKELKNIISVIEDIIYYEEVMLPKYNELHKNI